MITIDTISKNEKYKTYYDIIKANSPISYGGTKLYTGKRDYLMQSPSEFAATLTFLEAHFEGNPIKYLEIGTASGLTNSMIWNILNVEENIMLDNLECPGIFETMAGNLSFKQNSVLIIGDSTSQKVQEKVGRLQMKYDLMLIDGNHTYEYVKEDYAYYNNFIKSGGLLIFHDTENTSVPGVKRFIETSKELKDGFTQVCNFVDNSNIINRDTFGSVCGIGIYKKQ